MNKNVLRIGNLVDCFGVCKVVGISLKKIKVKRKTDKGNYLIEKAPLDSLELSPIKLTEKWLLYFGFELKYKDITTGLVKGCYLVESSILPHKTEWTFRKVMNSENSYSLSNIKYVHELQNLYFALTKKELTRVDGF
jgi:hypothetical protein